MASPGADQHHHHSLSLLPAAMASPPLSSVDNIAASTLPPPPPPPFSPAVEQSSCGRLAPSALSPSQTVDGDLIRWDFCKEEEEEEEEEKKRFADCRICHEEDCLANLHTPCSCSGSLKYAHRKCVQKWCDEKGDTICEICRQPFKGGYVAPPPHALRSGSIRIEIDRNWGITGPQRLGLRETRILATATERRLSQIRFEECPSANITIAACCHSAALILMALLLLRHVINVTEAATDKDIATTFTLFLFRAAGFLLPCFIMVRAMNLLHRRHHRQEAAMAAAEVAMLLQIGQD